MTVGERITLIRKDNKLSMEKFGNRIGITRASVSLIESGTNNPSNQTIDFICKEFNVNREWLLSGEGDMYDLSMDEDLALFEDFRKTHSISMETAKKAIKYYMSLDETGRQILDDLIDTLLEIQQKKTQ